MILTGNFSAGFLFALYLPLKMLMPKHPLDRKPLQIPFHFLLPILNFFIIVKNKAKLFQKGIIFLFLLMFCFCCVFMKK